MIPFLCVLLPLMLGVQGPKASDLTGSWDGFLLTGGKLAPRGDSWFWKLELSNDGKFRLHMENHVMINLVQDAAGNYVVGGSTIKLSGQATTFTDDGYRQSTEKSSYAQSLTLKDGVLRGSLNGATARSKMGIMFSRPGQVLNIPRDEPRFGLTPSEMKPSDPRVIKLAAKVESAYASLASYNDQGVLKSATGAGKAVITFENRFRRPDVFSFRFKPSSKGHDTEVWSTGGKTTLRQEGKSKSVASVTQGFVEISGEVGGAGFLMARLLLPRQLQSNPISDERQLLWKGEQSWEGRKCEVIQAENVPGADIEYWIDPTTFLLRRVRETNETGQNGLEFVFHPRGDQPEKSH